MTKFIKLTVGNEHDDELAVVTINIDDISFYRAQIRNETNNNNIKSLITLKGGEMVFGSIVIIEEIDKLIKDAL